MDAEYRKKYKRWATICILLTFILFLTLILSSVIGSANISPLDIMKMIAHKIPILGDNIQTSWKDSSELIFFKIRLPRVILAMLIGTALAVAGVTYQAIFKNPMADPYIIGVSSGAALGANIAIILGLSFRFIGLSPISFFAFFGAMAVTFFVYRISLVGNRVHVETLLLSGIAVGSFLSAVTSFLMYIAGNKLHNMVYWMMGGLWTTTWSDVYAVVIFILAGVAYIIFHSRDLNLLLMGDETAHHLGVDVEKMKKRLLASASLITAFAVSVSGLIGFVGLVIPHIMRIIVGPDHRILTISSALFGGIFLIIADTFARNVFSPTELPVGVVTAFFGGPFFTYLLISRKRNLF